MCITRLKHAICQLRPQAPQPRRWSWEEPCSCDIPGCAFPGGRCGLGVTVLVSAGVGHRKAVGTVLQRDSSAGKSVFAFHIEIPVDVSQCRGVYGTILCYFLTLKTVKPTPLLKEQHNVHPSPRRTSCSPLDTPVPSLCVHTHLHVDKSPEWWGHLPAAVHSSVKEAWEESAPPAGVRIVK